MKAKAPLALHQRPDEPHRKDAWPTMLWASIIASTGLHFLMFALWPPMRTSEWGKGSPGAAAEAHAIEVTRLLTTPPEAETAAPPSVIETAAALPADPLVIPDLDWASPPESPALAPTPSPIETRRVSRSSPALVPAVLLNAPSIADRLRPAYEDLLGVAAVEGRTVFELGVDQGGRVRMRRLLTSSGHPRLDQLAEGGLGLMRFSPGLLYGQPHPTVVRIAVGFQVRAGSRTGYAGSSAVR